MAQPANNPYLRDAVMTAPPEQLQLMLYDGAIRFALRGREAILANQHEESYDALTRAQKIMLELTHGLREEVDPPLVKQVASLYMFIYRKLVEANINKDAGAVDDAVRLLHHQRETWVLLLEKLCADQEGPESTMPTPSLPESPPVEAEALAGPRQPTKRPVRLAPAPSPDTPEYQPLSIEG